MVQAQDSSDPTGVSGEASGTHKGGRIVSGNSVARARQRKSTAAVQLRLMGTSWTDIALTLGYPTARAAIVATERALERELHTPEDRDALRRLAGARLDRLLRSVWGKAIDDKHPEHLIATTKARELIAQHAKLFGLDAPTEIVVHNPTQSELEAWVARVVSAETVEEYDILDADIIEEPPDAIEA